MGEKIQVHIQSSSLQSAGMGGSDAHPSFFAHLFHLGPSGGTSRPAGETVCVLVTVLPGYQVPDYAEYEPRGEVGTCVKRL